MLRFVLAAALSAALAAAQAPPPGAVEGVVQDSSGSLIPGAVLTLEEPGGGDSRSATTLEDGRFAFDDVPPGERRLTIEAPGFEEVSRSIAVQPGELARLQVRLDVAAVRTEVTVRPNDAAAIRARAQDDYEANKSATSVEGELLVRNNPVSNYDALRYMPGVMTAAWGGRDRFSTPTSIRGAGAWGQSETIDDYPAVQVVPVSAEDGGYTASLSSSIPSLAVETLTLATGGLGAQFGQAAGGVVRSRIRRGDPDQPHATLRAEGVGVGEVVAMGDIGGGFGRLDYYFSGQTAGGDYGDAFDTYARPIQDLRAASGIAKVGFRTSRKGRLEGMFVGGDERHSFFQRRTDSATGADIRTDFHTEKDNYLSAGRYDHRFSEDVVWGLGLTHNRFHENRIEDFVDGVPSGVSRRNRPQRATTAFTDLTWQKSLTDSLRYSGSAGVEVRRDRFADITNQPVEFSFGEDAVYFRNSLNWAGLTVNTGLRSTRIDNHFDRRTRNAYDVGLAYRLPTRTRLKASYSTGYKLNKPFYLWWGGGNFITRDPGVGLRPSTTETTEFGVEQAVILGPGASGVVRATVFRTDESDLFNFGNTGTGVPYYDQLRSDGFELWSEWRVGMFRPFVSFTHLDVVRTASDNPVATNVDLRFAPLPGKAAGFGTFIEPTRRLQLSVLGSYDNGGIQEQLVNDQIVVTRWEEFLKFNALASFALNNRFSLLVRAENLLNRRDLGYSRSVLNMDGTAEQIAGTQRDPGLILAAGVQIQFGAGTR